MRRQAKARNLDEFIARDSGFVAEPVIGPRFARTRWRRPEMTKRLFRGRARPRPLRTPHGLERLCHGEHAEIVEAAADDLDADWKTA
jgi:hypothetical protein